MFAVRLLRSFSAVRSATPIVLVLLLVVLLREPSFGLPLGIDEGGMSLIGTDWLRSFADGRVSSGMDLYGDQWIDRPPLLLASYGAANLLGGELGVRLLGLGAACLVAVLAGFVAGRIAGPRARIVGAALAGSLTSMRVLDGDRTTGELLAAVPSVASIALLCAIVAGPQTRSCRRRWLLLSLAGACAASAPLVKQSALDAGVAATAWFAWRACTSAQRPGLARDVGSYATGALLAVGATIGTALYGGAGAVSLGYALIGFRVDVLAALDAQSRAPLDRASQLLLPALQSGLLPLAVLAPVGIAMARRSPAGPAGAVLLAGWCLGSMVGVAGGGYFWSHYLLQLVAPIAVVAAIALSHARAGWSAATITTLVAASAASHLFVLDPQDLSVKHRDGRGGRSQASVLAVAQFVRRNSTPDDRLVVLYARANLPYHAQRRPATPFAWSSMYRALPAARIQLLGALRGPRRAEWVVAWQRPRSFGMDRSGNVRAALRDNYRHVGVICGKPLLVRSDRPLASVAVPPRSCADGDGDVVFPASATGRRTVNRVTLIDPTRR